METKCRRSPRKREKSIDFPILFSSTFFGDQHKMKRGRRDLVPLHSSPNIYMIENFLTEGQLRYFDAVLAISNERSNFCESFTENDKNERVFGIYHCI